MILKPGMQKRWYLQLFWSLGCKNVNIYDDFEAWDAKNDSIYNDFEAWDAKTTVFTTIVKRFSSHNECWPPEIPLNLVV